MTTASNLLAFLGLVVTLLIVWRQSWPARLRLFAAQSLLLAALASTVGVLAQRVAAGDAEREPDQRHRERQGDGALGRQLHRRGDRQHDHVGRDHEPAHHQERDAR